MSMKRASRRGIPGIKPDQDPIERQIAVDAGLARTAAGRKFLAKRGPRKPVMQAQATAALDDGFDDEE